MMPNVSAGRAALQFNLNGPNFVVDAGSDSLKAAFAAAGSLLLSGEHSGTRLAIVAAIDANRWPVPGSDSDDSSNEYACAFAITTRGFATASQLQIVDRLQILTDKIEAAANRTTESKVYDCIHALNHPHSPPPNRTVAPDPARTNVHKDEFPIHAPIWIESPISASPAPQQKMEKCLAIVLAKEGLIHNLMAELPKHAEHHLVVVVGEHADELARRVSQPNVVAADLTSEDQAVAALNWIEAFCPTTICAFDSEFNWNLEAALSAVAGNELCEMLFLTMKRLANRIRQQQTDVWALFPGGWDHRQQIIHPTTGAISGLLKSTRRELPHGVFGVLSHQSNSISDALAGLQFERMSSHHADVDIVHDGIRRMTRRLRAVDLDLTSPTPTPVQLDRDSVVVATGGARGVTAIMVEAILKDYGCTVVTLGRSVLEPGPSDFDSDAAEQRFYEQFLNDNPNATPVQMRNRYVSTHARWEAHNSIQQMAALDGNISYLTVDVTRPDDVDRVMAEIIEEFGRIDLVIHGAGVQWSKKIEDRKLSEFRTTFNVKVGGLKNLVSSARSHLGSTPPVHILTSAYSIFGNDGQHDYGAANEAMDRLCDTTRISDDGPAWTSIAWSAWNAIGMTRGSEYKALAGKRNLALLNPQDGQRVFRAVMQGITGSGINVPLSESERTRYRVRTIPPATSTRITRRIEMPVRLTDIACLPYHKARGSMTLPGAWTVDYMVRAASQLLDHPPRHFTVEDMKFVRFVRLTNEHDANIRVIVEGDTEGFSAWLIGDVINPAGITLVTDVVFASAKMTAGLHATSLTPQLGGELKNGHGDIRFVNDPYCAGDPSVDLSGPFDCLPEIEIGPLGRRATFSPISSDDWGGTVPAMLLDASLRVAGMHVVTDALHVPVSMDKVVIPTGISTDSYAARGWRIQTATPNKIGDDIRCERVEVLDEHGQLQLYVEGALVTQLK
jgi:NAD(P)-dependent dehydrogenase (short-subunit alcohol dehydrogenase family)